jgi:hypothetical protein
MNTKTETADKILSQFFNGKNIGKNLKEMAVDMVKTDTEDVVSRWYHAPSTDLFTWTDRQHNIIKQQLHFNGQVVEWNCLEGVKTGLMIEADLGLKATYNAEGKMEKERISETIKFDALPMNACVDLALEILEFTQFEDAVRRQLIGNFKDPQNISTMEPELFLKRFGAALKQSKALKASNDAGFFNSIRERLLRLMR